MQVFFFYTRTHSLRSINTRAGHDDTMSCCGDVGVGLTQTQTHNKGFRDCRSQLDRWRDRWISMEGVKAHTHKSAHTRTHILQPDPSRSAHHGSYMFNNHCKSPRWVLILALRLSQNVFTRYSIEGKVDGDHPSRLPFLLSQLYNTPQHYKASMKLQLLRRASFNLAFITQTDTSDSVRTFVEFWTQHCSTSLAVALQ